MTSGGEIPKGFADVIVKYVGTKLIMKMNMNVNVFIAKQTSAVHDRDLSQRVNEYTASDSSCT